MDVEREEEERTTTTTEDEVEELEKDEEVESVNDVSENQSDSKKSKNSGDDVEISNDLENNNYNNLDDEDEDNEEDEENEVENEDDEEYVEEGESNEEDEEEEEKNLVDDHEDDDQNDEDAGEEDDDTSSEKDEENKEEADVVVNELDPVSGALKGKEEYESRLRQQQAVIMQLEAKVRDLKSTTEEQESTVQQFRRQNGDLIKKLEKYAKVDIDNVSGQIAQLEKNLRNSENLVGLQSDKISFFQELAQNKQVEIDNLRSFSNNLKSEIQSLQNNEKNLLQKLESFDVNSGSDIFLQAEKKRLSSELEVLRLDREKLAEDYDKKCEENLKLRREMFQARSDLSVKLSESEDRVEEFKRKLAKADEKTIEFEKQIYKLSQKNLLLESQKSETERNFENELMAKSKLYELSKDTCSRLEVSLENAQNELIMQEQKFAEERQKLKTELNEQELAFAHRLNEAKSAAQEEISRIVAELNDVKQKLADSQKIDVSAVSFLTNSAADLAIRKRGMTVTGLYSDLTSLQTESKKDKAEIKRLTSYLIRIENEIQEKAPEIIQIRKEYDVMRQSYDAVSTKLNQSMAEIHRLKATNDLFLQQREMDRERCESLLQENTDLAQQIRALLSGGKDPSKKVRVLSEEQMLDMSPEEIISEHLVEFTSVDELQQQNQNLLKQVRQLSKELESQEDKIIQENSAKVNEKLSRVLEKFKTFKENRNKQELLIKNITQQRDFYKEQAERRSQAELEMPQGEAFFVESQEMQDLKKLKEEYDQYKEQVQLADQNRQNLLTRYKEEVKEATAKLKHAEATIANEIQKGERLKENLNSLREEIAKLRQSEDKFEKKQAELNELLSLKEAELKESEDRTRRMSLQAQSLSVDNKLLKKDLEHLEETLSTLKKQKDTQVNIVEAYKSMEETLKTQQKKIEDRLLLELNEAKLRVADFQRQQEDYENEMKLKLAALASEKKGLESQLHVQASEVSQCEKKIGELQSELESKLSEINLLRSQLEQANKIADQIRGLRMGAGVDVSKIEELSVEKLSQQREEIKVLKAQIDSLNEDVATFKTLAESSEKAVHDLNLVNEKEANVLRTKMAILQKENDDLKHSLDTSKTEISKLKASAESLITDKRNFDEISRRLGEAQQQAEKEISSLREMCSLADEKAAEAEQNYSRELTHHARTLEKIQNLNIQVQGLKEENSKLIKELAEINDKGKEELISASNEANSLRKEKERLQEQQQLLSSQNDLLNGQLTELANKVRLLQKLQAGAIDSSNEELKAAKTQTKENALLELLENTNKQKSLLAYEKDELQIENANMKSKINQLKREVEELKLEASAMHAGEAEGGLKRKVHYLSSENELLRKMNKESTEKLNNLRDEEDKSMEKIRNLEDRLASEGPKLIELKGRLESLEKLNASLQKENETFQSNYSRLLSKFGEKVDPVEFESAVKEKEALKLVVAELRSELSSRFAKLQREVAQLKEENRLKETSIQNFRMQLEDYKGSLERYSTLEKKHIQLSEDLKKTMDMNETKAKMIEHLRNLAKKYKDSSAKYKSDLEAHLEQNSKTENRESKPQGSETKSQNLVNDTSDKITDKPSISLGDSSQAFDPTRNIAGNKRKVMDTSTANEENAINAVEKKAKVSDNAADTTKEVQEVGRHPENSETKVAATKNQDPILSEKLALLKAKLQKPTKVKEMKSEEELKMLREARIKEIAQSRVDKQNKDNLLTGQESSIAPSAEALGEHQERQETEAEKLERRKLRFNASASGMDGDNSSTASKTVSVDSEIRAAVTQVLLDVVGRIDGS